MEDLFKHCQQCDHIVEGDYTFCPKCGELLMEYDKETCEKYRIDTKNILKDE